MLWLAISVSKPALEPFDDPGGDRLWLFHRREMAGILDDREFRVRNRVGDFLMLRDRAPAVLAAGEQEDRAADFGKVSGGVRAADQSADLALVNLGARAQHHFLQPRHQLRI